MVLGALLGAAAGPLIGGITSAFSGGGGGGGGSSSAGQRTFDVFEPGEDENLGEFLDLSF